MGGFIWNLRVLFYKTISMITFLSLIFLLSFPYGNTKWVFENIRARDGGRDG